MQQPGLELELVWDVSITGISLMCRTTVLAPEIFFHDYKMHAIS